MTRKLLPPLIGLSMIVVPGLLPTASTGAAKAIFTAPAPRVFASVASDLSPALSDLALNRITPEVDENESAAEAREEHQPEAASDTGFAGDTKVQSTAPSPLIPAPSGTFEGLSNQDNVTVFGGRVNPPDPVGAVGPNHFVEMVNLVFAVYDKSGNRLLGPVDTGTLWSGFAVEDCTDPSGDPVVLYDQFADRWLLSQFTTAGPKFYDCVAISQTPDPTGPYYRYAFVTQDDPELDGGTFFPDYPKYSVWKDSYVLTTRDFGDQTGYGVSVYALEKNKMVNGQAKARAVQYFIDAFGAAGNLALVGDGLLPADVDGKAKPKNDAPIPIIGTQDAGAGYGATTDALNIFELDVHWNAKPVSSFNLATQLPVAPFDSIFPCVPAGSRACLPQPGTAARLDILSYRQRPTFRLGYRNFGTYESLVTNQSVEAAPGVAGVRWYEVRRAKGAYSIYQQGTFAPGDGVHRWMGSVAMDWQGNIALGYSVVNGTTVFPGIRYTGRLAGDPLGQLTLGEGVIIDGTGVQLSVNSRWGDYSAMSTDPSDDCRFWFVSEYYTAAGQALSTAGWQTRVGSFQLPGCYTKY